MSRGPIPKADAVTRNRPTIDSVTLGTEPAVGRRAKTIGQTPKMLRGDVPTFSNSEWRKLHVATREWWVVWLESPQGSKLIGTDWNRLKMMVLPLVESFNRAVDEGDTATMLATSGRIITLEKEFGATPEARGRMRWNIQTKSSPAEGVDDKNGKTESEAPKVHPDPRALRAVS